MEEKLTKAARKEIRKQERHNYEAEMGKELQKEKTKKAFWWFGGIILIILSIWGLIALANTPTSSTDSLSTSALNANDITKGPKNAKVKLVEYADFQCPACGAYYPLTKQLEQDFSGKVLFIYRFFPLQNIHQNATISAQAGYAAYLQGKFWEMHDMLFQNQKDWATITDPQPIFMSYAQQLGLDTDKFKQDIVSDKTKKFISDEENAGINAGVNATPTFLINGKSIQNPSSYADFKQQIQNALK